MTDFLFALAIGTFCFCVGAAVLMVYLIDGR